METDLDAINAALVGDPRLIESKDRRTGQTSWISLRPIGETGWTLGVLSIAAESMQSADLLRQRLIAASLALLAAIAALSRVVSPRHRG